MRRAELLAAAVALVLGAPLVFLFARALSDGAVRAREAPYRALLGDEVFESLAAGDSAELHYLGDDRLAPDFELRDREGKTWRLSEQRGKAVLLNFWTITCQPCIEEMPSLDRLAKLVEHRDDIEVVSVSTDAGWEDVRPVFFEDPTIEVLFDPDKSVVNGKYGTALYPETWLIDADGVIRLRVDGPRDWSNPLVVDLLDQLG